MESGHWGDNPQPAPSMEASVSGKFKTNFQEMAISQNGNKVTGTYKHQNGRIEGTLNGHTLTGHTLTGWWYQSNGKGRFVFEFSRDFSSFTGKWGYNSSEPNSGTWSGNRILDQ